LFQDQPTGMLDAILIPKRRIHEIKPEEIWITWCDQVAVGEATVQRLAQAMVTSPKPQLAFPTLKMGSPYIHFARDSDGTITSVLQRREGDAMPEMRRGRYRPLRAHLPGLRGDVGDFRGRYPAGYRYRGANFLPFIPWLAEHYQVRTIPATAAIEAVGINTPEDLAMVGKYLAQA
jgi:hypothetical protein